MFQIIINQEIKKTIPWKLVAIFLCFSVAIILSGILFYKSQRSRLFGQEQNDLTAIASLKVNQIEQWHYERLGDAAVIRDNEPLINRIKQYFRDENQLEIKSEINNWMESVANEYDYRGVLITDTDLKVRLSVSNSDTTAGDAITEDLKSVLRNRTIFISDLHKANCINFIHIDILIPLIDRKSSEQKIFGIMILRIDPEIKLFPLIQSWPTPSRSSETLLLRKEGDSVLYLTELRHQKNTALKLKLSLNDTSLLASKAVLGMKGVFEGRDYRNIPVMGYLTGIRDSNWFLVTKVDKEEIQAPVRRYFIISVIIVLLLILINASVLGFWVWNQRLKSYQSQLLNERSIRESEEKLHESEELFRKLFHNMLNGFAYCKMIYENEKPKDFIYLNVNTAFESLTGLKNVEGRKVSDVIPGIQEADPELLERYGRVALTGIPEVFEIYVESLKMWFAISVYSPQKEYFVAVFDVITERKHAEEALRENEKKLREAQEMAHLGFWKWDIKSGDVEWSAEVYKIFHLNPEEFTPQIDSILALSPWEEDHKRNTELINRAIATHEPGDYEQKFLLPDNSVGYYYSTFQGKYDEKGDLNSIVGTVLDITERKNAIEALRLKNMVFDVSIAAKFIADLEGKITEVNNAFLRMWGYKKRNEIIGKAIPHFHNNNDDAISIINSLNSYGEWEGDYIALRSDGSTFIAQGLATVVKDENDNIIGYQSSILDITDRSRYEALLSNQKRIGDIFLSIPDDEMYFEVLKIILELMRSPFGVFGYIDQDGALVVPTMTRHIWDKCNIPEKTFIFPRDTWGDSSWPRAIREKKANYSNEISLMTPEGHVTLTRHISFPILFHGDVIGLFQVANKMTDYTEEDISTLNEIALYIAPILSSRLLRELAQRDLVELSERQNAILTSVPDIIMEVDVNKVYTWANNSGYDFFGDDVIGKEAAFYFEGEQDTYKVVKPLFAGSDNNIYIESWQRRKDGEKRLLAWWCRVLKNEKGTVTGALSSALDITERVLAESEIRKLNEELESRVIQRTEQLEVANKELEAFSYSVSHDLRAPLRSVHGYTKILMEEYENKLDDEGKRICGIISSSATQMGGLIDDLLSFSRIGRSSLNPSLIDMKSMVLSVFADICSNEEKSRITLKVGKLQKAYGDASLIRLVWINLISNAIKYSSKENSSEISVSSSLNDHTITFSVKDNGVGFDMQYKHKLFGVFQRLHSGIEFEGNGVGLAIVQRIVLRHGGKVKAAGEVGKGATFCFSLPADGKDKRST